MANKVVIISQNQSPYLMAMISTLASDIDYIVVLDRCTDNSELLCLSNSIKYVTTDITHKGFYAGYARDFGARDFNGNILFLDGDRIPQFTITNDFITRYAAKWDMSLLRDMTGLDTRSYLSHKDIELEVPHSQYCHIASCGMILSESFISKIRYQNGGNIFNPIFNGAWGCEDSQLGDIAFYYGAKAGFVDDSFSISGYNLEQTMAKVLHKAADSQYDKRLILKYNLISNSFSEANIIDDDTPFCIRPFTSLSINMDSIMPCNCVRSFLDYYYEDLWKKTNMSDITTISGVWQSDIFDILRKSIKYNKHWFCTYDTCSYKYLHSINDLKSSTCIDTFGKKVCDAIIKYMHTDVKYNEKPVDITYNYSNACNLKCVHCRTQTISHTTEKAGTITRVIKSDSFFKDAVDITLSGTGEPFFDKELNEILENSSNVDFPNVRHIHIITNGLLITEPKLNKLLTQWNKAAFDFIISIPGSTEDLSRHISPEFNYGLFMHNIKMLSDYRRRGLISQLNATFVYQKENFMDLQNVIDMLEALSFDRLNVQYIYKSCWCTNNVSDLGVVTTNKELFDKHEENLKGLKANTLQIDISYDYKSLL